MVSKKFVIKSWVIRSKGIFKLCIFYILNEIKLAEFWL